MQCRSFEAEEDGDGAKVVEFGKVVVVLVVVVKFIGGEVEAG